MKLITTAHYFDYRYDNPAVQSAVRSLIEEEMASMPPRDYLAHLPPPPDLSFPDNPVLASEVSADANAKEQNVAPPPMLCARILLWLELSNEMHFVRALQ